MTDAAQLWRTCASIIRSQVSDVVWQTTFNQVSPVTVNEHELVLAVPNALAKERVDHRYRSLVHEALTEIGRPALDVRVEVHTGPRQPEEHDVADLHRSPLPGGSGLAPSAAPHASSTSSDVLTTDHLTSVDHPTAAPTAESVNRRYTFDDFVTGTSNRFAHAAALAVAETPARSYNPLFIYGDAGLGKTHLLQAIANYVHDHYPTYKVRYVSTETFLNRFVDAIRTNTLPDFKQRYREIDVLLVDDIQFMEGKEGLQEEFFHTFNSLHHANRQIVLSSDRPPDAIPTIEDRLRSRFKMGLITDIQPPDLETRLAILRKKGDNAPIPIPPAVLEFIASHITDNIRELEGALTRVSAYATLNHVPCTVELAEQVLGDMVARRAPRPLTPALILAHTSKMYGLSVEEITGSSRRRPLVNARQIAMYVIRELTDLSYPAIAREFGGRDHTTVIHAVEKIKALMGERRQIYEQVTTLIDNIKSGEE